MSAPLVPDALWEAIQPLLPQEPPKPEAAVPHSRPRRPRRHRLRPAHWLSVALVLKELGCGSNGENRRVSG
jgi:hypothetical protein